MTNNPQSPEQLTETDLVLFAQSGDRDALESLLSSVYPALRPYIASLTGETEAEDILQEALIQACRKLKWLREPAYFRPWLFRIASRIAFAWLRKSRRWQPIDDEQANQIPDNSTHQQNLDWLTSFTTLLYQVSPASRAVLMLHYANDLTIEEIAAILEIPVGTVKSRLSYGIQTLRQKMKEQKQ